MLAAVVLLAGSWILPATAEAKDGWLGVQLQPVDEDLRDALQLEGDDGALVSEVVDGSPAEKAGVENGDVVVELDGRRVTSVNWLVRQIRLADPGDEVVLAVVRDGDRKELSVVLGEREEPSAWVERPRAVRPPRSGMRMFGPEGPLMELEQLVGGPRLGVETRNLDPDLAGYFGVDPDDGLLIVNVLPDTPAESAGLRSGDILTAVDGKKVDSPGELRDLVLEREGETVKVEIVRHGDRQTIDVTLEEADRPSSMERSFMRMRDGELRRELESLRQEVEKLREELDRLKED
jgi:serine protease Do